MQDASGRNSSTQRRIFGDGHYSIARDISFWTSPAVQCFQLSLVFLSFDFVLQQLLSTNEVRGRTFHFQSTMAPSVRGTASRVSKRQAGLRDYAKISKVTATHPQVKSKLEEAAVASIVNPKKTTKSTPKRKRSDVEDDSEADPGSAYICANGLKKVWDVGIQSLPSLTFSPAQTPVAFPSLQPAQRGRRS